MEQIKAIVQKVTKGKHGAYAVAKSKDIEGSITFSLDKNIWQEPDLPESGTVVVLSKLTKKRAGWRANRGRFLKPSDEEISNQERSTKMNINYIKKQIIEDIIFQPELQQEVAKTLLALLKIRKSEYFPVNSLLIVSQLEEKVKTLNQLKKELGDEKAREFVTLHETKKAAFLFHDLTDQEAEKIRIYLEEILIKKDGTLEQYMARELGLTARDLYDPDEFSFEGPKNLAATMAMLNSGNTESFQFNLKEEVSSSRINEIITSYYTERGYKMENDLCLQATKEKEDIIITVTNCRKKLMVTVVSVTNPFN